MWQRLALVLMCLAVSACSSGSAGDVGSLLSGGKDGALGDSTIVQGLKEALQVGTRNATNQTSQADGFWGNAEIRIPLPEDLRKVSDVMRTIGMDRQVQELEVSMNRAAERAASEAFDVFWNSIKQMTIADARQILDGPDDAATRFFERTSRTELHNRWRPIVQRRMAEVGVVNTWDGIKSTYHSVPAVPRIEFDLTRYIVDKALDGLFLIVSREEAKIRRDPAARVTEILKLVFG